MYVYLLLCTDNSTYVGATVNLERRLRQHNKEIKGGAVATGRKVEMGKSWQRVCYVSGFPDWQAALQFEWKFKFLTRKLLNKHVIPVERRIMALHSLLNSEKSTTKAIPFADWEENPTVNIEECKAICEKYFKENELYKINNICTQIHMLQ